MHYSVIIAAAGQSKRFADDKNKLLYPLSDGTIVLEKALKNFRNDKNCTQIIIVSSEEVVNYLAKNRATGREVYCYGGESRSESIYHGLLAVKEDVVLVHDGARCYLEKRDLDALLNEMQTSRAVIMAKKETDTVKLINGDVIMSTINRDSLARAQTPQAFYTDDLIEGYKKAIKDGFIATDEASIMEKYSDVKIKCVFSVGNNEKITTLADVR